MSAAGSRDPPDLPGRDAALLLDLDGTLLDLAATPSSVVVTSDLVDTLRCLRGRFGDALAIVTGRPVDQVDALLADLPYAVAGEHGGAVRHAPGGAIERPALPVPPASWLAAAAALVARHPGTMLERKQRGFVVHYRAAPTAGAPCGAVLERLVAEHAGAFQLMPASMAWEIRPRGADKGTAVAALMRRAPFAGRVPLFIGDDATDADGIATAKSLGGRGYLVPDRFGSAAGVRAWLRRLAAA